MCRSAWAAGTSSGWPTTKRPSFSVKLDKIAAATQTAAFATQALLRNPFAFGEARSECTAGKPDNPDAACSYTLAPGVSMAAAKPLLDLSGNLAKVLA